MTSNHAIIDLVNNDSDNDCRQPPAAPKPTKSQVDTSTPSFLVLEQDQVSTTIQENKIVTNFRNTRRLDSSLLFHDTQFPAIPASIRGQHKKKHPNCHCRGSVAAKLDYKKNGRPYFCCSNNACRYFSWAYQAEFLQWFRFGTHSNHVMSQSRFSASDLHQGRVGDCWFLSALAVVAERPDLISRLVPAQQPLLHQGLVQVNLFLDGKWETVVVDNFLPCMVNVDSENELQMALEASSASSVATAASKPPSLSSSKYDPFAIANDCRETLRDTQEFLEQHQLKTRGRILAKDYCQPLVRPVTSQDLAYSTAQHNQLWVPFLEKAYAKSHGSYSAISGGHIAEAFLDLTGAPTLVDELHSHGFSPRSFWYKLLQYRKQQLPMGCGTDNSAAGIIGMHAYSILDVKEVKNVPFAFFQETGVAHGNVSGFTDYDGTVRLLQIRNPHGKGEWKGDFSDQSCIWERLLQHGGSSTSGLERTMKNDGTFYIDYDNFLMGFANVDVVLCHVGNHAKSFSTNFATKKSNHRCARAFEVSLLEEQPGLPNRDTVELFIMGIQKTRRGASSGRADRKKSYKVSDLGMLVGQGGDENRHFTTVKGEMFGFRRDGHYRLILDRKKTRRMVVMPISFGHPTATDKELPFTLRFVSDAPLLIRELPDVPRMDLALQKYCLEAPQSKNQGVRKILLQDSLYRLVQIDCRGNGGGVVFLYLCVNETKLHKQGDKHDLSFAVEANCRGMSCRTETGLLEHKTVAKGKKFEAAWRRYSTEFIAEQKSRLLLVLYQSGQDTEFGSINCKSIATPRKLGTLHEKQTTLLGYVKNKDTESDVEADTYERRGVFNSVPGGAFENSVRLGDTSSVNTGWQQDFDGELERALALSRGDVELQEALEASRQKSMGKQPAVGADLELQQVLETSKNEAIEASRQKSMGKQHAVGADLELQQVLEMSKNEALEASQQVSVGKQHAVGADLELEQVLEMSKNEARAQEVMSIDDPPAHGSILSGSFDDDLARAIQLSMQPKAAAKVVDLTDKVQALPTKRKIEAVDNTDEKPVDQNEKRRLAAEAALKRLQK